MAWDEHQNLFLSTGDDTNPGGSDGYSPIDFRKGREGFDALKTAGNTNDLRGKILRIKPLADGSYLVPDGNLFEKNNPKARPEIYVMGCRNPYRISYDKRTKTLYWGDIGPDAGKANTSRGPEGFVEINKTSSPGNFGWPMFVADHKAYNQFDFENKTSGQKFNPQKPINLSPNNTGLKELPKAETAFIYYSYVESAQNPLFGKGGCNPMAGPVYYSQDYKGASAFPSYFDSTFFAYEWMRDWVIGIKTSSLNLKTEKLFTNIQLNHPIDMDFGPDGSLYILDYGVNWFQANSEAALSKIEYIRGNRSPVIKMSVNKTVGGAPLTVQFSSKGTFDPDGDALTYSWFFGTTKSSLQNPKFTFNKSGEHTVKFEVKDAAGNKSSQSLNIIVGNNYPMVRIVVKGNKTFVIPAGKSIDYQVSVSDIEDGTLSTGIDKSEVAISQNLIDGYDLAIINQGHQSNLLGLKGKRLIASSDCRACHAESQNSVGPSYKAIAERYPNTAENSKKLIQKIIEGGGGVWGEHNMAAHPDLKESDVKEMLDFILNINKENNNNMPTSGKLTTDATFKNKSWILKATYSDKGNGSIKSLSTTVDYLLRPLRLNAISAEFKWEVGQYIHSFFGEEVTVANANGSYFGYKNIDLTGLKGLKVYAYAEKEYTVGGTLELRLDSPKGPILDSFEIKVGDYFWKEMEFPISVTGQHNVFFVYKNPNPDNKALFGITQIEFLPE